VNQEVNQMVTKDMEPTKIVVDGEGHVGKNPNRVLIVLSD